MTFDYDQETPRYIAHGLNIFQAGLVDGDEFKTVELIHTALNPHHDSVIMDFGAGIGGVPKMMLQIDPTLKFIGVSNSKFQTDYINAMFHKSIAAINCDFHCVPLPDNSIDYAMFNETIGYGDLPVLLREVSRLLKVGGRVVIKDFTGYGDDELNDLFFQIWGYRLYQIADYNKVLSSVDLKPVFDPVVIDTNGDKFNEFVRNDPLMRARYASYTPRMLERFNDALSSPSKTLVFAFEKTGSR